MLKLQFREFLSRRSVQPPSGGCVLKQHYIAEIDRTLKPAAFRRLCVETNFKISPIPTPNPAAFRRLCVETQIRLYYWIFLYSQPPSGGCVLKPSDAMNLAYIAAQPPSGGCVLKRSFYIYCHNKRLPAAFRRLCVETLSLSGCRR